MNDGLTLLRGDPVRDLARAFAATAARHDCDGSFPHENIAALRDADAVVEAPDNEGELSSGDEPKASS